MSVQTQKSQHTADRCVKWAVIGCQCETLDKGRKSSWPKVNFEEALLIQREAKRVSKSVSEVETVDLGEVAKVVHAQDEDDGGQGSRAVPTSLPQTLSQVRHHGRENGEPQTV